MRPVTDEDLVLHYYGESDHPEEIERELEHSPEVESRYRELCAVLDAVSQVEAPEPPLEYGSRLWRQLEPRIAAGRSSPRSWLQPLFDRGWAVAAVAVLLLVVGVLAGRFSSQPAERVAATSASQKILMDTVAGHLQRTEILLLELRNAREADEIDFSVERSLAGELSRANRLYRQAARGKGYLRTAALLDDLELLLLEVAHASELIPAEELAHIRRRLDEGDLLFKVQVVGARLRRMTEPDRQEQDA